MSGFTSPASQIALPARVAAPSSNAHNVQSLAAFTDVMADKTEAQAKGDTPPEDERQDDAATGKSLPEKDDKTDPALAWLLAAAPIVPPKPVAIALPAIPVATAPIVIDPAAMVAIAAATPAVAQAVVPETPKPATDSALTDDIVPAAPVERPAPQTLAPQVQLAKIALQEAPAPAQKLAASAAMPALFALAMTPDNDAKRDGDSIGSVGATSTSALLQPADAAALIAKPGGAQGQALDTGRQDWPQKMIDHIEALRDGANANDTSIRLKPEALGRVDIALRTHSDGAISVRFTAEQPATRTLIADATPQLNAAAEARGIRLSGTSVDLAGSGMGSERQRPQVELSQNISNHLTASGGDNEAATDGRIA